MISLLGRHLLILTWRQLQHLKNSSFSEFANSNRMKLLAIKTGNRALILSGLSASNMWLTETIGGKDLRAERNDKCSL